LYLLLSDMENLRVVGGYCLTLVFMRQCKYLAITGRALLDVSMTYDAIAKPELKYMYYLKVHAKVIFLSRWLNMGYSVVPVIN
jgi:hypothetical protein